MVSKKLELCQNVSHFTLVIEFSGTKVSETTTFFKLWPAGSVCPSDASSLLTLPFWAQKVFSLPFAFCQAALSYTSSLAAFPRDHTDPRWDVPPCSHIAASGRDGAVQQFRRSQKLNMQQPANCQEQAAFKTLRCNEHAATAAQSRCLQEPRGSAGMLPAPVKKTEQW